MTGRDPGRTAPGNTTLERTALERGVYALAGFCLENRLVVLLLAALAIGWGLATAPFAWNLGGLPRDRSSRAAWRRAPPSTPGAVSRAPKQPSAPATTPWSRPPRTPTSITR